LTISEDLQWVKTHVILLVFVVCLAIGGVYCIETIIAKHDDATNARWQAINQAQIAQVKDLSDKLSSDEKERAQENAQQTAILAQLAASISQRDKNAATTIKQDSTLQASDIAKKLTTQTGAQPGEITTQGDNTVVDLPMSRIIVANLDQLPTTQADLIDTQKQLVSETNIASNFQSDAVQEADVITAMKNQEAVADKACKAQIADVKAQARKSKIKYLLFGGAAVELIKLYFTHSL
jgi:hypothetical protein